MNFRIKNWKDHQHFKDRTPPWIKLHRDVLNDPDWHSLDGESAKTLIMLWLIASDDKSMSGTLPNIKTIAFRLRKTEKETNQLLTKLSNWLIQVDVSAISERCQSDAPETETETETENKHLLSPPALPKADPVRYEEIVNLYHQTLPMCPKVVMLTSKRKGQIAARWKSGNLPDMDTWKEYFEFVSKSDWLTGKVDPSPGRKRFVADLEFLTNESNFAKIAEKKYHGKI